MDDWEVASLTYQVHSTTTTTTNTNLENKSSPSATNSNSKSNSNNSSGENVIVKDASAPTPIHNSHEDVILDDGDGIATQGEEAEGEPKKLKSINDYYNTNNIGLYQTLSLVLNAGLMIYAQGRCIFYVSIFSMHNI